MTQAIRQAIIYCKTHDLMGSYFTENENEVFDMVNFKWDQSRALEIAKEDGIAIGEARGRAEEQENTTIRHIKVLMQKTGLNIDAAMDMLDIPERNRSRYAEIIQKDLH